MTPDTGDVVHYAARTTGECLRAVVTDLMGSELLLRVAYNDALGNFTTVAPEDPWRGPNATSVGPHNDFTRGTWHPTH